MEDQVKVNSGCKPADGITNGMLNKIMLEMAYDRLPLELRRVAYYRWVIKGQYSLLQTLTILGLTKDQYYYWQRKLKETCIDTFERQAATFVELPVTKEVPISTELTVTHTVCKNDAIAVVIKTNGITFEITNTATSDFIKNLIEVFNHA